MRKFGSPEKRWRKQVVLALVLALLVNFSLPFAWQVPEVRNAYAASGDVILLWDTANGAVPAGWTSISSLPGDAFYGVFPRAAATYGAATAGADTHTPTLTYVSATQGVNGTALGNAGAVSAINTHTHTWGAPAMGAGDVRPPFKNLIFIKAASPAQIPANAIVVLDGAVPVGFTRYATLDGVYLRGFSDNLTGGAATHTHTTAVTSGTSGATVADSGAGGAAANDHTHTISANIAVATNAQPFVDVIFAYNSSGAPINIPSGAIAFFDATPPANWTTISNAAPWTGNFLRGSATFGTTGGSSANHDHGASAVLTSGTPSASATNRGTTGASTTASNTHTHNVTYTVNSQASIPVYRDVILAKYTAAASGGSLLHNSTTTGSAKWSGSWGVAGGRYGAITCETCHIKSTGDVKRVKDTVITAPNTPTNRFPAEVGGVAPVFTRVSGNPGDPGVMGDDSTNPRASSNKICEVCHTYDATAANGTKYHAYSGGINSPAHQNNAKDCTGCHKHKEGFKAPACDTCHGEPPTAATLGGPTGLANSPNTTGSATAGAHNAHAVTLLYGCSNCHNNQNMPQTSTAKPGFGDISIGFSNWGSVTGSYSGQLNVSYNNTLGTGTKTCSTVYCHGSSINGPNTAAVWDGLAGSLSCASAPNGACHNASAANPPTIAAHQRHAASGTYNVTKQGLNVACSDCHGAAAAGHVNGDVSWSLNTASTKFSATASYKTGSSGSTGARAPSATYGTCSNVYCHSTVTGDGGIAGAFVASPAWNSTTTCASCHRDQAALFTGKHQTHTIAPYSYACATCHNGAGAETVKHADVSVDVAINATYGGTYAGTPAPGNAYSTCSSVYCHGNFTGGLNASPNWGGTAACGTCHGAAAATPPSNVNHPRHAGSGAGQLGLACAVCHPARAVKDGHEDLSVQWDLDRLDARLGSAASYRAAELGSTGAKAPSATYGTCTSVYCHSNVQNNGGAVGTTFASPTWGALSVACDSCHGQAAHTTGQPATGSHELHVVTGGLVCTDCHNAAGYGYANHSDGMINMAINTAYGPTAAYGPGSHTPGGAYGTCTTTYCHGTGSPTWGANTTYDTCVKCHGVATSTDAQVTADAKRAAPGYTAASAPVGPGVDTGGSSLATDAEVGAHDVHLRGVDNISSAIACTECHKDVSFTSTTFTGHMNGAGTLAWGTLAATAGKVPVYTKPNCTSNYCHTANRPAGAGAGQGGLNNAVAWNSTTFIGNTSLTDSCINKCHAMPPGAGIAGDSHAGVSAVSGTLSATVLTTCSSNGSGCHPTLTVGSTTTVGALFADKTLHIDGQVQGGDCISCHSGPQTDGTAPSRRAMSAEFTSTAHGHAKTAGWTKFMCGVCHMEGDPATGNTTALHKNNTLDFRDPDSGVTIKGVTFTGTPGSYSSTATDATASVFARNTGGNVLETFAQAVMVNMCLKCHDGGATAGANSAAARVTGGTATQPFGTTAGTVINVNDDFATTNATYHPVRGKQNNWYADTDTMNAPWNPAARTAPANNTTYGYLITCWDCHDSSAAGRTIGGTTAPSVLHGNAATVRAPYDAVDNSATQICVICHKSSVYWTNSIHNIGAVTGDSALDSTSDNATWATWHGFTKSGYYVGCTVCHGTTPYGGALPAAGSRSKDVHGANTTAAGGTTWPTSATPPYSFLRMTNNLGVWDNSPGTCTNMCGTRDYTYTSGGTY